MLRPPCSLFLFFGDDNAVLVLNWLLRSASLSRHCSGYVESLFIFRCPAALSASVARVSKNAFLSFLALFLTSLLSCQYLDVRLFFLACSVQLLISTFNRFLCVIRFHVSAESHYFWLFLLFPRTSSQDFCQVCFSAVQWLSMSSSTNSRAEYLFFTEQLNESAISLLFRFWVLCL